MGKFIAPFKTCSRVFTLRGQDVRCDGAARWVRCPWGVWGPQTHGGVDCVDFGDCGPHEEAGMAR